MKGVWISLVIAAAVIIGSIVYTNHIDNVSQELGAINDRIMVHLENENYADAADETEKLSKYLEKKRTILDATGDHEELNKIEMNVSEMEGYIDGKQQYDAISRSMVLDFMFSHLPRNYKLKMENIL